MSHSSRGWKPKIKVLTGFPLRVLRGDLFHPFSWLPVFSCQSLVFLSLYKGFPGSSNGKESALNAGDPGSIPWSGRSPLEGNGYPLQSSCLENSMDRGAWRATVHGVAPFQSPPSSLPGVYPVRLSVSTFLPLIRTPVLLNGARPMLVCSHPNSATYFHDSCLTYLCLLMSLFPDKFGEDIIRSIRGPGERTGAITRWGPSVGSGAQSFLL